MEDSQEDIKADYLAVKELFSKSNVNILFVRRIKIEGKNEKNESKLIAITTHRIYVITKQKQNAKIDFSFHILELSSLEYNKSMMLTILVTNGERQQKHGFLFKNDDDLEKSISYMVALLKSNFTDVDIDKHISLKIDNEEKLQVIKNQINIIVHSLSGDDQQSCGSFSLAYKSVCDLFNQQPLEEVIWDINKIYASHNCKTFNIEDFDHLELKELIPLLACLSYNRWFTSLQISSFKLTHELVDVLIKVFKRSPSIEEFTITDTHIINKDQIHKISLAISANPYKVLQKINFSKNPLEDKGVASLCSSVSSLELESLCLSDISITTKGVALIANSFKSSKNLLSTLTYLDLSNNAFKMDGAQSFCDFVAHPNNLEHLDISNTDCALDLMFGALLRGCQQNLQSVNLSGNPFSYKKSKEIQSLPSFQQFFSSAASLKNVDIANTKIPAEALKAIFVGLMSNPVLTDVGLNLSKNELKSTGANVICSCVKEIKCLVDLDLSENGFDGDLVSLCEAIQNSSSIKRLNLSQNITKSKYNNVVGEALADMVMSDVLPLEKLSVADLKLRHDAAALFDCLGTNESITQINISGNLIGDVGARLLAKALQINTKLKVIHLDKNGISHKGLHDISLGMARNYTLMSLPIPTNDLQASLKHHGGEQFVKHYTEIEKALIRNQASKESTPEQLYKIHQNLLLGTVDHYTHFTDSLVVQLQDLVLKNKDNENENVISELITAKHLIKETDTFRQLLLELFSDPLSVMKSSVEIFNQCVTDLSKAGENILKTNVDEMVSIAKRMCPTAFDQETKAPVTESLFEKSLLSNLVPNFAKSDITFQLCEANLTAANSLSEILRKILIDALTESIERLKNIAENPKTPKPESSTKELPSKAPTSDTPSEIPSNETAPTELSPEISVDLPSDDETKGDHETEGDEEIKVSSPAMKLLSEISQDVDMPWEFTDNRLSKAEGSDDDGDTSMVAANKARSRLSTMSNVERQKRKKASLKRRPTFLRQSASETTAVEVDISLDDSAGSEKLSSEMNRSVSASKKVKNEIEITKSSSVSKTKRDSAVDQVDYVDRTASIGGFDDVSAHASQLRVAKDRVKPIAGRRAPSRVSNLAHMNTEATDAYIDEQSKAPPRPMSPRPVSAMPSFPLHSEDKETAPLRRSSESVKNRPETPKRPDKKESKKEKKGKSPIGGIKLPTLPGLLKRKDRSSSKGTIEMTAATIARAPQDTTDNAPVHPPTSPTKEPTVESEATLSTLSEESGKPESMETEHTDESSLSNPPPRPDRVKRPMSKVPPGMPLGGGALLEEMKRRQAKDKGDDAKDGKANPTATARPQRPKPPEKPEHRGSVSGPRPPPPKRPPSMKKPSESIDQPGSSSPTPPARPTRPSISKPKAKDETEEMNSGEESSGKSEKHDDVVFDETSVAKETDVEKKSTSSENIEKQSEGEVKESEENDETSM